jgi:hypothetical protein
VKNRLAPTFRQPLTIIVAALLVAGCDDQTPFQPQPQANAVEVAASRDAERATAVAALRSVTARYKQLELAVKDGFVLLHPCETRPDEGPVGTVYVHLGRLTDGKIDPALPDALIYEPQANGRLTLVGVEFAILYTQWTEQQPPQFLGATFQPEDEFGVWALHAWVWRANPLGLFAESNPNVSCLE